MTDNLAGSRVIVKTEQGALIGGTLWASSPDGALFIMKEEICLNVELAAVVNEWQQVRKEAWRGKGEIVDDPRGERPMANTSDYYEEVSLDAINRKEWCP